MMALWDKDFLDMMEPAYIAFDASSAVSSPSAASQVASTVERPPKASSLPGRVTTRWMKPQVMAGPNFRKTAPSKEKFASITAIIQPSRLADGEFFNNLLSCSQSRTWTQTFVSGKTGTRSNKQAHTAGGRRPKTLVEQALMRGLATA